MEEQAIIEASEEKPTWSIRKITSYLNKKKSIQLNHKRVEQVRRANNLQAYTKRKSRRRGKLPLSPPHRQQARVIDDIWSYDFKQDRTQDGRVARILVFDDEHSHKCLQLDCLSSYSSTKVKETLSRNETQA